MRLFDKTRDYEAFEEVLGETLAKVRLRVCAFSVMPNHWHFVVWPEEDGQLGVFFQRLGVTHVTRWSRAKGRVGYGHVYQGRFKSFPVETEDYFYQVVRYAERNALRANLVSDAAQWRWSSLWIGEHGTKEQRGWLSPWPVPRPRNWLSYVNGAETEAELKALRHSVQRGTPYGRETWVSATAERLRLQSTLRGGGFAPEAAPLHKTPRKRNLYGHPSLRKKAQRPRLEGLSAPAAVIPARATAIPCGLLSA
jgi:putative transposase